MSFTKVQFNEKILQPQKKIQSDTLENHDMSNVMVNLDAVLKISDKFNEVNSEVAEVWNDIISDLIASISSASSGFYRTAILNLRSILELSCNTFYYLDHNVEYYLFKYENAKADKYVSVLVNEHQFFTTKYINSFKSNVKYEEKFENSICTSLKNIYGRLSDVVHGRYNSLLKVNDIQIKYSKESYKTYEKLLCQTIGIICVMFIFRFNIDQIDEINKLAERTGAIK